MTKTDSEGSASLNILPSFRSGDGGRVQGSVMVFKPWLSDSHSRCLAENGFRAPQWQDLRKSASLIELNRHKSDSSYSESNWALFSLTGAEKVSRMDNIALKPETDHLVPWQPTTFWCWASLQTSRTSNERLRSNSSDSFLPPLQDFLFAQETWHYWLSLRTKTNLKHSFVYFVNKTIRLNNPTRSHERLPAETYEPSCRVCDTLRTLAYCPVNPRHSTSHNLCEMRSFGDWFSVADCKKNNSHCTWDQSFVLKSTQQLISNHLILLDWSFEFVATEWEKVEWWHFGNDTTAKWIAELDVKPVYFCKVNVFFSFSVYRFSSWWLVRGLLGKCMSSHHAVFLSLMCEEFATFWQKYTAEWWTKIWDSTKHSTVTPQLQYIYIYMESIFFYM